MAVHPMNSPRNEHHREELWNVTLLLKISLKKQGPSVEQILDEINETTRQYINVDDPVERAARQQHVL